MNKSKLVAVGLILGSYGTCISPTSLEPRIEPRGAFVKYTPRIINTFFNVYGHVNTEIPMCQFGHKHGNKYAVVEVQIPVINYTTPTGLNYNEDSCNRPGFLGMAHNHIGSDIPCMASDIDLGRFVRDTLAEIETIVCEEIPGIYPHSERVNMTQYFKKLMPDNVKNRYRRR